MRIPRIYHPEKIQIDRHITLKDDAFRHTVLVLRLQQNDTIMLFDGCQYQYRAILTTITKKYAKAFIIEQIYIPNESPLHIHLGQVISRGEKMEFTIQKSVELGVNIITPLISERCGIKLDVQRFEKKIHQWQKITISACEQCGRNIIPLVQPVTTLTAWYANLKDSLKLNLHPLATQHINSLTLPESKKISLLIGPEGGLSEQEIKIATQYGFTDILLGPRVLRTETAALAVITALQVRFGDLG